MEDFMRYDHSLPDMYEPHAIMMETFDDNVNRNAKDSIFCDLFGRPEYCLQLYKVLHPEEYLRIKKGRAPDSRAVCNLPW